MNLWGEPPHPPKRFLNGTHRACSPEETFARFSPLMGPLGITRLANVTGLDRIGLPVYVAVRPNSRSLATSQGKGLDPLAAKVSALMESIEVWHGEHLALPLRHEQPALLAKSSRVLELGLGPQAGPCLWVEGEDLLRGESVWVPHDAVSVSFVWPAGYRPVVPPSSNGLASGNHLVEATVHGLCELIERDAITLWEYQSAEEAKTRQVDPATVDDAGCLELLRRMRLADVDVGIWDVTSDTGIPAYACELFDGSDRPRWRRLGIFGGYGCHLSPAVALMRALSEAVQSRLAFVSGSRDDLFYSKYRAWTRDAALAARIERIRTPAPAAAFRARASLATDTFEGDLQVLVQALRRIGLAQAAVVNLSRPELKVPVVKVVVPGLEARLFASDYQPGPRVNAYLKASATQEARA